MSLLGDAMAFRNRSFSNCSDKKNLNLVYLVNKTGAVKLAAELFAGTGHRNAIHDSVMAGDYRKLKLLIDESFLYGMKLKANW